MYSEQGMNLLIDAILRSAQSDFAKHSRLFLIRKYNEVHKWELQKIIDFIASEYYVKLTNGNSPQRTCINGLLNRYLPKKYHKEILEGTTYYQIKETK